jgi:hypothetical protein
MNNYPFIILIQQTTGGQLSESTGNVFENVATFFGNILAYLVSVEFIGNLVATAVVVVLAILFYKLSMRLVPRIVRWRLPEDEEENTYRTRVRIQRRDTAVTLVRQILRYITFAVVALFILSIFLRDALPTILLRDALPTIAGASILAAVIGFSAQNFVRERKTYDQGTPMIVDKWVDQMVVVEYMAGSGFNLNEPGRMPESQHKARSGRFILKEYDERGIRLACIPTDPCIYSAEHSTDFPADPCVYVAWNAVLTIKPLSEEAYSEPSEEGSIE